MIFCDCSRIDRGRFNRRLYIREGAGWGYRRKYKWVPVGFICIKCRVIKLDGVPEIVVLKE